MARSGPTKAENNSEGESAAPDNEVNKKKLAYTTGAAKMSNDINEKSRVKDQAKKDHTKKGK